jgi:hypothetical protein
MDELFASRTYGVISSTYKLKIKFKNNKHAHLNFSVLFWKCNIDSYILIGGAFIHTDMFY